MDKPVSHPMPLDSLGENLVFLLSLPRSGSTFLQQILNSHPRLCAPQETWVMLHPIYARRPEEMKVTYNAIWAKHALDDIAHHYGAGRETQLCACRAWGNAFYRDLLMESGKDVFIDKTPRYYHIIPDLAEVYPKARFIFLVRNPMAVLRSVLFDWVGAEYEKLPSFKQDLIDGPRLLMEGQRAIGERAISVHYDELVQDPAKELQKICTFLDVSYEPSMLNYGEKGKPKGRHGDTHRTMTFTKPTNERIKKWHDLKDDPWHLDLACYYAKELGDDLLKRMGTSQKDVAEALGVTFPLPDTRWNWNAFLKAESARSYAERLHVQWHLFDRANAYRGSKLHFALKHWRLLAHVILNSQREKRKAAQDA